MKSALHLSIAVVLVALAAAAALLASDVRDWQRALAAGPVRPASQWKVSRTCAGSPRRAPARRRRRRSGTARDPAL